MTSTLTDDAIANESLQTTLVERLIEEKFNKDFVDNLKRLCYYISRVGLTFEEACRIVRIDVDDMRSKIKAYPMIQELIDIKELQYKTELIRTISEKAITHRDDKLAMWLLEHRFPEEFNKKKGSGGLASGAAEADLLGMAIEFVQRSSTGNGIVKETAGRAFITKKTAAGLTDVKSLLK